ncbi:endo-1,4-beta-xylanase 1 precursor, putative [Talaromyces stipitatus ATCC 10500]|uniref:Endo-1,4-beta-xylanase n=1 Tax=Talaromyces stipitatus (strain ATCC 10500 / CBS 375.48 / QM 6759 / NRRL 1006) TaxID=441959 RepID=B8MND2_TALSN|nr:endo-1,4-beta-xylanase 1 precursor, putative [Talaromyces stipitatus ATCC 10500]EED14021.1 endo-1,4-beta-xylanase 1 precursor, putative [Talaromyces stipitatus ATCC 10500]
MRSIAQLTWLLSVAVSVLAAPTELSHESSLEKRGPHNFVMGPDHPLMMARQNATLSRRSTNYKQDYVTGGTVNFSPGNGEFSVSWNTHDDFVVGVGWNPGNTLPITHSGSFDVTSGLASLSVYGWSTDPLVEYYIIDEMVDMQQAGTQKGTVYSDGATYTIWENTRVNEPSIQGTSTFNQYISIRNSGRTSGTITVENHFNAWKQHGMNLGKLNFQVIAVESWNGSGNCKQTVSN